MGRVYGCEMGCRPLVWSHSSRQAPALKEARRFWRKDLVAVMTVLPPSGSAGSRVKFLRHFLGKQKGSWKWAFSW